MIKKTITFEDLNGNSLTKDFYFNLSKAEIVRKNLRNMNIGDNGEPDVEAFKQQLQAIINSKSGRVIMDTFEDIIRESYGERDEDGIAFHKSEAISSKFMATNAYDVLFLDLVTDANKASEFVNGIMPKDFDLPAGAERSADLSAKLDAIVPTPPAAPGVPRTPLGLPKAVTEMSREELLEALAARPSVGGGQ